MADPPQHVTAAAPIGASRVGRGCATLPRPAGIAAATIVLLVASCSHPTTGTATSGHPVTSMTTAGAAPHNAVPAAPTPLPASDEDQAKATVNAFQDAYNTQNWAAYTGLMCAAMRAQFTDPAMDSVRKGRADNGPATIKSMTIAAAGDTATATIEAAGKGLGPGDIKLTLKREGGWKVCQVF